MGENGFGEADENLIKKKENVMMRTISKIFVLVLLTLSACGTDTKNGAKKSEDCNGIVNGEAFVDPCGNCVGGDTRKEPCQYDCNGVAGGGAYKDYCGECVGGNTGLVPCRKDCDGVFGGSAFFDECGQCVGGETGKEPCEKDCSGVSGGEAYLDPCGKCVGGNTGLTPCQKDCNDELGGAAYLDNCGECVGGSTGQGPCKIDCNGEQGGKAYLDPCGNCVGGNSGDEPCEKDCNGVFGGLAFVDSCGDCVGGNTGQTGCESDCAREFGEDAELDDCGVCVGGSTGKTPCEEDCSGLLGGSAFTDTCGECVGGNTGKQPCGKDCNGDHDGTAFIDDCSNCVGGGTGRTPCPSIALGEKHSCVLRHGELYCWGRKISVSSEDGQTVDSNQPMRIGSRKWQSIWASAYYDSMYGIQDEGGLYYFWFVNRAMEPKAMGSETWKSASVGGPPQKKNYAIRGDDRLFLLASTPAEQDTNEYWGTVSAGLEHVCAIALGSRELYCWGRNWEGQLGLNDRVERQSPVLVDTGWQAVSAGSSHTCAIKQDGRLYCWGSNSFGQLGIGDFSVRKSLSPAVVGPEEVKWKTVSAGMYHTCGIQQDDRLFCWGSNYHGQLGDSTKVGKEAPVAVGKEEWKWRTLDTGGYHTCAIRQDGKLFCWGWNDNGQLGVSSNEEKSSPTLVELAL